MEDKTLTIDWKKIREISERAKKQEPWDFGGQFGVDPHSYAIAQTSPEKKEEFQKYLELGLAEEIDKLILWLGQANFPLLIKKLSPYVLLSLLEKISTPTLKNIFESDEEKKALGKKIRTLTMEIEKIDGKSRFAELEKKLTNPLGVPEPFPESESDSNQLFESPEELSKQKNQSVPGEELPELDISHEDMQSFG